MVGWLLVLALRNLPATTVLILRPVFARDILEVGAAGFSAMGAAYACRSLTSTFFVLALGHIRRHGLVLFGSMALWDIATLVHAQSREFGLTLGLEFILGTVGPLWQTAMMTMLQSQVPQAQRGVSRASTSL